MAAVRRGKPRSRAARANFTPEQHKVRAGWHPSLGIFEVLSCNSELAALHGRELPIKALYRFRGRISTRFWGIHYNSALPQFPRKPPVTLDLWVFADTTIQGEYHITDWEVVEGPHEKTQGIERSHIASIAKSATDVSVSELQDQPSQHGPSHHSPS